ncbi:MAG: UvrB/UvrC motif-containing protein [Planctomycetota bacterium]|nr:UvrB/UvrC motif-containing protein [Planctomycetota bacterium]
MKCEKCDKRATVHIIDIRGEVMKDRHMCQKCARSEGYIMTSEDVSFEDVLNRLINDSSELVGVGERGSSESLKVCHECGTSLREVSRKGVVGCENDYDSFRKELSVILEKVHGSAVHVGKTPTKDDEMARKQQNIQALEKQLEEAVKAENFELAAKLRDQLAELK